MAECQVSTVLTIVYKIGKQVHRISPFPGKGQKKKKWKKVFYHSIVSFFLVLSESENTNKKSRKALNDRKEQIKKTWRTRRSLRDQHPEIFRAKYARIARNKLIKT